MDKERQPIGVFDSGIGGVSVLKALQRQLPFENFVYFADTAHLPYGDKTPQQIKTYTRAILTWMQNVAHVKMVVAACNTSSAIALPTLASHFSLPIIGTIEPLLSALKPTANIGIIATSATADSGMHEALLRQHGFTGTILAVGCPAFVPLIEAGLEQGQMNTVLLTTYAQTYFAPFHNQKFDTLVYGCTHYPLIRQIIEPLLPPGIRCIDPADSVAKTAIDYLKKHHLENSSHEKPSVMFECNAGTVAFKKKLEFLNTL